MRPLLPTPRPRGAALARLPVLALAALLSSADVNAEEIRCQWRLEGLQGAIARLLPFVPASGEALLTVVPVEESRVALEFKATAPSAAQGEHWTYGAEFDPVERRTLRVAESSRFRGRDKHREHDLSDEQVIDLLSGLHLIRTDLPDSTQEGILWANRRLYPVALRPEGAESREIGGRKFELLRYVVRGRRQQPHRYWKETAEVWLAAAAPNQPVEMLFKQRFGRVRLTCPD